MIVDPNAVDDLIARANAHPDGLEILRNGHHDSVAVYFGVHPFVVDAARERLGVEQAALDLVEA